MPVVTVTLNPAIDETISVDRLVHGEVHRAHGVRHDAGGKGVNVASCLADWGAKLIVTGFLGEENAGPFEGLFRAKNIADRFIRVPGATRTNLKIVDDTDTTDINLDGPEVSPDRVAAVEGLIEGLARPGGLIVLSGSLPLGCPPDQYARLIPVLAAKGARVLLDASGPALKAAFAGPVLPYCIKPNRRELAEYAGRPLDSIADVAEVAAEFHARGVGLVVVSMGQDGALFLSDEGMLVAKLAAGELASTVGAGDAMVAGIAAALSEDAGLERIARLATAFAVAKLGRPGPHLPDLATVHALADEVKITETILAGEA